MRSIPIRDSSLAEFQAGHEDGWHTALYIYGLRNCTIRNDGNEEMRVPIGRREAYLDLAPGEVATIRTVDNAWPEPLPGM